MNWNEFFSMDGRGFFVWMSFGALLVCVSIEIIMVRLRIDRAQVAAREDVAVRHLQGGN